MAGLDPETAKKLIEIAHAAHANLSNNGSPPKGGSDKAVKLSWTNHCNDADSEAGRDLIGTLEHPKEVSNIVNWDVSSEGISSKIEFLQEAFETHNKIHDMEPGSITMRYLPRSRSRLGKPIPDGILIQFTRVMSARDVVMILNAVSTLNESEKAHPETTVHVNGGTHGGEDGSNCYSCTGDPETYQDVRFTDEDFTNIKEHRVLASFKQVDEESPPSYYGARITVNAWCHSDNGYYGGSHISWGNGLLKEWSFEKCGSPLKKADEKPAVGYEMQSIRTQSEFKDAVHMWNEYSGDSAEEITVERQDSRRIYKLTDNVASTSDETHGAGERSLVTAQVDGDLGGDKFAGRPLPKQGVCSYCKGKKQAVFVCKCDKCLRENKKGKKYCVKACQCSDCGKCATDGSKCNHCAGPITRKKRDPANTNEMELGKERKSIAIKTPIDIAPDDSTNVDEMQEEVVEPSNLGYGKESEAGSKLESDPAKVDETQDEAGGEAFDSAYDKDAYINKMTEEDVSSWLHSIKMGMYADVFKAEEINGEALPDLDDECLKELGVTRNLHVKKIKREIRKLMELEAPEAREIDSDQTYPEKLFAVGGGNQNINEMYLKASNVTSGTKPVYVAENGAKIEFWAKTIGKDAGWLWIDPEGNYICSKSTELTLLTPDIPWKDYNGNLQLPAPSLRDSEEQKLAVEQRISTFVGKWVQCTIPFALKEESKGRETHQDIPIARGSYFKVISMDESHKTLQLKDLSSISLIPEVSCTFDEAYKHLEPLKLDDKEIAAFEKSNKVQSDVTSIVNNEVSMIVDKTMKLEECLAEMKQLVEKHVGEREEEFGRDSRRPYIISNIERACKPYYQKHWAQEHALPKVGDYLYCIQPPKTNEKHYWLKDCTYEVKEVDIETFRIHTYLIRDHRNYFLKDYGKWFTAVEFTDSGCMWNGHFRLTSDKQTRLSALECLPKPGDVVICLQTHQTLYGDDTKDWMEKREYKVTEASGFHLRLEYSNWRWSTETTMYDAYSNIENELRPMEYFRIKEETSMTISGSCVPKINGDYHRTPLIFGGRELWQNKQSLLFIRWYSGKKRWMFDERKKSRGRPRMLDDDQGIGYIDDNNAMTPVIATGPVYYYANSKPKRAKRDANIQFRNIEMLQKFKVLKQHTDYFNVKKKRLEACMPPLKSKKNDSRFSLTMGTALRSTVSPNANPNIIFLGPTGSGKTSLLNLILNYETTKSAQLDVEKFKAHNRDELENDIGKDSASKTSSAHQYRNVILEGGKYNIIDTPGFGDTRGIKKDEEHVKSIIQVIQGIDHVKAIVIVLNGREARVNHMLSYIISEITGVLPKDVLKNVFVVFTNTERHTRLNFEVSVLEDKFGLPVNDYCLIENPLAELEKARSLAKSGKLLVKDQQVAEELFKSFVETIAKLSKFFNTIGKCENVHTKAFLQVYNLRQEIEKKMMDLFARLHSIQELKEKLKKNEKDVQTLENESWYTVPTGRRNTICKFPKCHSNCHENCRLWKKEPGKAFLDCEAFGVRASQTCLKCSHGPEYHHHSNCKWVKKIVEVDRLTDEMRKKYEEAKTEKKRLEIAEINDRQMIEDLNVQKKGIESEIAKTIDKFQGISATRNFIGIMANQAKIVEMEIRNCEKTGDDTTNLQKTLDDIQKRIQIAKDATQVK